MVASYLTSGRPQQPTTVYRHGSVQFIHYEGGCRQKTEAKILVQSRYHHHLLHTCIHSVEVIRINLLTAFAEGAVGEFECPSISA